MIKIKSTIIILFLTFVLGDCCSAKTIHIVSQQDFEMLNQQLNRALNTGSKTIKVVFTPGVYFYSENHLLLDHVNAPSTKIYINGKGATLVPLGDDYSDGDVFQGKFTPDLSVVDIYYKKDISFWSDVYYAESRVELLDEKSNLWRFKCSKLRNLSKDECRNIYITITCWFTSFTVKVDYIVDEYLYFLSDYKDFNNVTKCLFLDSDYGYAKRFTRFKFCNYGEKNSFNLEQDNKLSLNGKIRNAHICKAGTFLNIHDCRFRDIVLKNFNFLGANSNEKSTALLRLQNAEVESINIERNHFEGIKKHILGVNGTNNLTFENNIITNCYRGGVYVGNNCRNTKIINNSISYCGLSLKQDFGISTSSVDYVISGNKIINYGYAAINVGVWHGHKMKKPARGIIENNEIYCTEDYLRDIDNYGLMDAGAIYVTTQNENVVIRGNYIHDIGGIKDNRGVFCDDGARNVSIYYNVICNIFNSYTIDSRRVSIYEDKIGPTNVGNVIRDNIVDGMIRFEAREKDSQCILGTNYYLVENEQTKINNIYKNLSTNGLEKRLLYKKTDNGEIRLNSQELQTIENHALRKLVKRISR